MIEQRYIAEVINPKQDGIKWYGVYDRHLRLWVKSGVEPWKSSDPEAAERHAYSYNAIVAI